MNVGFIGKESIEFLLARVNVDSDNHVTFICLCNKLCVCNFLMMMFEDVAVSFV